MPKLCLAKTKIQKQIGSKELKEAISDAETYYENNIKAYFTAAAAVLVHEKKQDFLKNLKAEASVNKINMILAIFSGKGFKEIGTTSVFQTNNNGTLTYPEAVCVVENCLSSYGYADNDIQAIVNEFIKIKNMWDMARSGKGVSGTLPIYDLSLTNEQIKNNEMYSGDSTNIINILVHLVS